MAGSTLPQPEEARVESKTRRKRRGNDATFSFWRLVRPRIGAKRFLRDLLNEIMKDDVLDGAAVLAYYSMLSIFPAAILILTLLPYLPIPDLESTIMAALRRAMPPQAADLFTSTVSGVMCQRRTGLLSFGALGTVWAASSGLQATMSQLHSLYDAKETRPYWKRRLTAILLVFAVGILVVGAFALVIVGDVINDRLSLALKETPLFLGFSLVLRWATILAMMLGALSLLYYFGPNVRQPYRFVTPGGLLAALLFVVASLGFRTYVSHFGSYEATYGSLGAAIILLLWLYVGAFVVLIGAEVNGLLEGYARSAEERNRARL